MKTIILSDNERELLIKVLNVSIEAFTESAQKAEPIRKMSIEMIKHIEQNFPNKIEPEHRKIFDQIKGIDPEQDKDIGMLESIKAKLIVSSDTIN